MPWLPKICISERCHFQVYPIIFRLVCTLIIGYNPLLCFFSPVVSDLAFRGGFKLGLCTIDMSHHFLEIFLTSCHLKVSWESLVHFLPRNWNRKGTASWGTKCAPWCRCLCFSVLSVSAMGTTRPPPS